MRVRGCVRRCGRAGESVLELQRFSKELFLLTSCFCDNKKTLEFKDTVFQRVECMSLFYFEFLANNSSRLSNSSLNITFF